MSYYEGARAPVERRPPRSPAHQPGSSFRLLPQVIKYMTNQDLREEAQHDVQSQGLSIQGPFTLCFLAFFSSLNIESQGQLFKNKLINDRDIMIRVKVCQ